MTRTRVNHFDAIVVGAGPGGSACAAVAAASGLRVAILERSQFPREKVCGDCINPSCWPVLRRLGVEERVKELPHAKLETVEIASWRRSVSLPLPKGRNGEIAVKRSYFDQVLLQRAAECGASVFESETVTGVRPYLPEEPQARWVVLTKEQSFSCRWLVAADGRNSSICKHLGLHPPARQDRIGLQTHLRLPKDLERRVVMRFLPHGYCGLADAGDGIANLCLVSRPQNMPALKKWAAESYALTEDQEWRSITPLSRGAARQTRLRLLLVGDAARVVEPFTGEGIYYALASGELAVPRWQRRGAGTPRGLRASMPPLAHGSTAAASG